MSDHVTIEQAAPRSIAAIAAFRDRAALLAALQSEYGIRPPTTPGFLQAGPVTLSCLSPCRYLATGPRDAAVPARLARTLAGLAAVTDQSDLWTIFTVAGPQSRDRLARLVPIDVAPDLFRIGALALTRAGHLDVRVWRVGTDLYEVGVGRSYAADLRHALG
jgi:sarcosine oxidase subunit gamma